MLKAAVFNRTLQFRRKQRDCRTVLQKYAELQISTEIWSSCGGLQFETETRTRRKLKLHVHLGKCSLRGKLRFRVEVFYRDLHVSLDT
jgi:hypothetical protein